MATKTPKPAVKKAEAIKTVEKLPRGRPSKSTPELRAEVCARLSTGEPLTVICSDEHMPCDDTVRSWAEGDATFSRDIAHARVRGFDAIAWEAKRIADTPLEGEETTVKPDGAMEVRRGDMLGHRKLQIETRLKLLAKWDPKRYGDKIEVDQKTTLSGKVDMNLTADEAYLRLIGK